ncbi:glycosyltransferase family 4 protein [Anaerobacillus sp. CMMVII]|uniref:glycosyltransferase family 4 protein n=1 Tax=Anaerobacillus sp. CMMVII TaxID=2755588 RepID=UPI0021B7E614|nr:glycosyltransferase family 4 protein [Anaerobacillus sp. CMMVII]MCT8137894.1 glycosyltransferase family 4 protein [Anaerobacillus sp. CMMVII]
MDQSTITLSFLTPYYHQGRGNATTARRIVTGLEEMKIATNVVAYSEEIFSHETAKELEHSCLFHVLHFRRFAEWLEASNYQIKKPYIITSGGTDVNIDIFKHEYQEKIGEVLKKAAAITVFSEDAKQKLAGIYPDLVSRIHIIKQSVWFPESIPASQFLNGDRIGPNILLPAGLRAVKDVLYVLPALIELKKQFPGLTFTILGAPLETGIVNAVKKAQVTYPWIQYVEEVPLEEMQAVYEQSDLVINTSLSEGQSSALLEAMYLGKPVIARKNGGNQSIIRHGETGYLFETPSNFYEQVQHLVMNEPLKNSIAQNGQAYVKENHTLNEEMTKYIQLYKEVIG